MQFGWRWGFGITGLLSFSYFVAFLIFYRDPSKHPRLSPTTYARGFVKIEPRQPELFFYA